MISIERPGWATGKYGIGLCPAMHDRCRDGVIIHSGKVEARPTCLRTGPLCDDRFGVCDGCGECWVDSEHSPPASPPASPRDRVCERSVHRI